MQPDTLYVDVAHDEMVVDSGDNSILVFPRTASGDIAPIRRIGGPKTRIDNIFGLAVDSVRDLIIVANRIETGGRESSDGILIFAASRSIFRQSSLSRAKASPPPGCRIAFVLPPVISSTIRCPRRTSLRWA